jgi:cytochrome bd ubiquinol oxidase subunit I
VTDLLAARLQMATSLGFHIIFASIGIAMPFLMAASHYRWLKTKDIRALRLTKAWSKGVAVFFATGAVSGTVLSFELGMLWPGFMEHAGPIIGLPFSWEGAAFFLEAIALGLFLYGWGRIPPWTHWACGVVVGISGVLSALFVICANGWMNSPAGFDWVDGKAVNIDPVRAMFNDAALMQGIHMVLAAFAATGFAVSGMHALLLLKGKAVEFHKLALSIAFPMGAIFLFLQLVSGDLLAKDVAKRQPLKLAAFEALFETTTRAPLIVGGIPDVERERVDYAIEIPAMLSFLAHGDFDAEVKGLKDFPRELWPPVPVVHYAFQIMVGAGTAMALIGALGMIFRKFAPERFYSKGFLKLLVLSIPLGFIAIEAGWTVTEVGRQPWIIYGIMKTKDALSPMPGLAYSFVLVTGLYLALSVLLVLVMKRLIRAAEAEEHGA